jgi:hypothetical protein
MSELEFSFPESNSYPNISLTALESFVEVIEPKQNMAACFSSRRLINLSKCA